VSVSFNQLESRAAAYRLESPLCSVADKHRTVEMVEPSGSTQGAEYDDDMVTVAALSLGTRQKTFQAAAEIHAFGNTGSRYLPCK
jgi:hypothetical protein